jgi:hypothetical protein
MAVRDFRVPEKIRKVYHIGGISPGDDLIVYNNCLSNLARGVAERVLYIKDNEGNYTRPPRPARNVVRQRLDPVRRGMMSYLSRTTSVEGAFSPISEEEFVSLYRGRRQTVYQNAVLSLCSRPVSREDAILKTFVKAEKVLRKAPRVIQPRDPRYNVAVGCFIKPIEHLLYGVMGKFWGETVVSKGLNASKTAALLERKWSDFARPVAYSLDAKRFDQHVSIEVLEEFEHALYNSMYQSPELRELLAWQAHNQGRGRCTDGMVKYEVEGCRMSGDMNTALGNCLIMCAMVHAYKSEKNIPCHFINNGDDCVVIMESRYGPRFRAGLEEWFLQLGFSMTVEDPVYELEQVDFCQCRPVWTPEGYLMVRNLHRALSKDSMSLIDISTKGGFEKWLHATGSCGLSLTGGIPVWQEMYDLYKRSGRAGKVADHPQFDSGFYRLAHGMNRHSSCVHPRTRVSFWQAFGVTPDDQEVAEAHFRALGTLEWQRPTPLGIREQLVAHGLPQAYLYRVAGDPRDLLR